jgi:hypothetical protein
VGPCSSTTPSPLTHSAAAAAAPLPLLSAATLKEPDLVLLMALKDVAGCKSAKDICRAYTYHSKSSSAPSMAGLGNVMLYESTGYGMCTSAALTMSPTTGPTHQAVSDQQ